MFSFSRFCYFNFFTIKSQFGDILHLLWWIEISIMWKHACDFKLKVFYFIPILSKKKKKKNKQPRFFSVGADSRRLSRYNKNGRSKLNLTRNHRIIDKAKRVARFQNSAWNVQSANASLQTLHFFDLTRNEHLFHSLVPFAITNLSIFTISLYQRKNCLLLFIVFSFVRSSFWSFFSFFFCCYFSFHKVCWDSS